MSALYRIHLGVQNRASTLDPAIMPLPDYFPVAGQHRADRDTALLQTLGRLPKCGLHVFICHGRLKNTQSAEHSIASTMCLVSAGGGYLSNLSENQCRK